MGWVSFGACTSFYLGLSFSLMFLLLEDAMHIRRLRARLPASRQPDSYPPSVGYTGWTQFLCEDNFWDVHAGRELPSVNLFTGASVDVWQTLGDDLVQSKWATSTRRLYQGWLESFLVFCTFCSVQPLPIDPGVLKDWLTRVAMGFASGTVQIAASAIIGFCLLNNVKNPLKEHPICKLVVDAAKKIKCGISKKKRAALDAHFLLDVWQLLHSMRLMGHYSIVNRRAKCIMQIAFEAALRGGEISRLKVCDLAFVACGPRCGLSCKSHAGSDAYLFVRLHKTSTQGSVKVIRLVAPEAPAVVGTEGVSAIFCLTEDWFPFLREQGMTRHPQCKTSFSTKFHCELCPSLFPSFPSKSDGIVRPTSVGAITEVYKKFAVLTRRDPSGYSSHSGRIGSFSDATAAGCDSLVAAGNLGWSGDKVPRKVYKRKTQSEARATGLALAESIAQAASSSAAASKRVTSPRSSLEHAKAKPTVLGSPRVPVVASSKQPAPSTSVRVPKLADKPVTTGSQAFPLKVKTHEGRPVCVRYQLGCCRRDNCPHAHVCHTCGYRHPDGRLCRSAIRSASAWKPE